jgi:hypothetical protein
MLERVITGGQTGADQAGWRAAKAAGIPTGGVMPLGFLTEDGPRPEFAELYGAAEMPTDSHAARTRQNVRDSDATVWFGSIDSRGYKATHDAALVHAKPFFIIWTRTTRPSDMAAWLAKKRVRVLNVAGIRESVSPGVGARVEAFLAEVFRRLADDNSGT